MGSSRIIYEFLKKFCHSFKVDRYSIGGKKKGVTVYRPLVARWNAAQSGGLKK